MTVNCASSVRDRVWAIKELSALPASLTRILSLVEDDSATALDLAEEIASDQALTMKILRTVNSAHYGFQRRIPAVPEAVIILGFNEVERLALAISVINLFGRSPEAGAGLRLLWRHSMACAVAASTFEAGPVSLVTHVAHVAGLLHDVGKAVIAQYFHDAVPSILRLMNNKGISAYEAEKEVLGGVSHCDIGAWLADRWHLPEALVHSIAQHHTPEEAAPGELLVHASHVADAVCNALEIPAGNVKNPVSVCPESARLFGLDDSLIERIRNRIERYQGPITAVAAAAVA